MAVCMLLGLGTQALAAEAPNSSGTFVRMTKAETASTESPWTPEGDYAFYLYTPSEYHNFDMMSGQLNPVILVYPDTPYASQEEAFAGLTELGLVEIAEANSAFLIVPEPLNGENYTEEDVNLYYESQVYLAGGRIVSFTPPAGEYERRTFNNMLYVIAEGSGATFVNNCLTRNANRIAAVLTFGGEMSDDVTGGVALPAYLVNASGKAVDYYKQVNEVDTEDGGVFVNSSYVEKKVIVAEGSDSFDRETISTAWASLLSRTTRAPMATNVVIDTFDTSEWVLMTWPNYEELGITLTETTYDWDGKTYIQENYVPASYDGSEAVPLVVLLHGFTEDPLCPAATCGWAQKAAEEGFVLIAPDYVNDLQSQGIACDAIMQVVKTAQETYNIDPSRIYLTGFSMGGMNTMMTGFANAGVFAAVAPMAGMTDITPFQADPDAYDLPTFLLCGTVDANNVSADEAGNPSINAMNGNILPMLAAFNGLTLGEPNYSVNPWGYEPDQVTTRSAQGITYQVNDFYVDGYTNPILELVTAEGVAHACSDVYADFAWSFMSRFARSGDGSVIERGTAEEPVSLPFPDVDASALYAKAVSAAVSAGIVTGYADGTFQPDKHLTWAEAVTMLIRAAKLPVDASAVYPGYAGHWASANIAAAQDAGIFSGADTFEPDQIITSAELSELIAASLGQPAAGSTDSQSVTRAEAVQMIADAYL
ncbi:MAG: prolyl oligopeptidase family serine peptidase [Oscillospiraceae bacterium]|nr:prolyl oligopeptidase family serine peptidase [Oscillospiraceae bacterium]